MRENTERPITIIEGTNTLAGSDKNKIIEIVKKITTTNKNVNKKPKYWDGKASQRIIKIINKITHNV